MNANAQKTPMFSIPDRAQTSPQKSSSSSHSGLRCRLTDCPCHEAHLPEKVPSTASPRDVTVTIAAAAAITFCAIVIFPPPPLPPIPVPYHAAAIRITSRMLWLVAISLPPQAMEDCSPTNRKIGAS